jgi:hypothetical protein
LIGKPHTSQFSTSSRPALALSDFTGRNYLPYEAIMQTGFTFKLGRVLPTRDCHWLSGGSYGRGHNPNELHAG